jgi:hypothetical protein
MSSAGRFFGDQPPNDPKRKWQPIQTEFLAAPDELTSDSAKRICPAGAFDGDRAEELTFETDAQMPMVFDHFPPLDISQHALVYPFCSSDGFGAVPLLNSADNIPGPYGQLTPSYAFVSDDVIRESHCFNGDSNLQATEAGPFEEYMSVDPVFDTGPWPTPTVFDEILPWESGPVISPLEVNDVADTFDPDLPRVAGDIAEEGLPTTACDQTTSQGTHQLASDICFGSSDSE